MKSKLIIILAMAAMAISISSCIVRDPHHPRYHHRDRDMMRRY